MARMEPHFTALEAAFQLHYYLWLKTHCLRPLLATDDRVTLAQTVIAKVCALNEYHLLESDIDQNHLRLLVSLQPTQAVSETIRLLKGNLQYQFGKSLSGEKLLAKGYFARTSGSVDLKLARSYVDNQIPHHGYQGDWTKALKYRNPEFRSPAFAFGHCFTILNYHLVFATHSRIPIFDEVIGPRLFEYLLSVANKHQFAVDRIGLLPDHMHMMIEGIPSLSVEDYALAIMNNTRHWLTKNYVGVLKEADAWNVWQPSYYAGTVGEFTTAQVDCFLRKA